jgi:transcriptional regulator with AAA-type ATPase domain
MNRLAIRPSESRPLLTAGSAHHATGDMLDDLIGTAPSFLEIVGRLPALARASEPVLIIGLFGGSCG